MDNGKPAYTYNYFGLKRFTVASSKKITTPNAEIKMVFDYDGDGNGKGGTVTIFVDGAEVASGRVEKTQPAVFSADETADVGKDDATQVADLVFKDVKDSEFTGFVNKVTISIPE
jgi:arylsulfatase